MIELAPNLHAEVVHATDRCLEPTGSVVGPRLAPRPAWTIGALVASDSIALLVAATIAALVTTNAGLVADARRLFRPEYLMLTAPLAIALVGLYPASALSPIEEFRRLTRTTVAVSLGSMLMLALLADGSWSWTLFLAGCLAIATLPVFRAVTRELHAKKAWWGVPIVILGAGRTAQLVIERLRDQPRSGLKPLACLDDDVRKAGTWIHGVPVTGTLADADTFVARGVRTAIIAMPGVPPDRLVRLVGRQASGFPSVVLIPDLFGLRTFGVETRDLGGVLGLHLRHNLLDPASRVMKRLLDLMLLLPTIAIGLPLLLAAALAVVLVSPGSPFYYQVRAGIDGRPIRVWKLRTMHPDATELLAQHLEQHPEAKREWERQFKLTEDPRILPVVGDLLRRTSLDELPQILNVLRGEMSFVGPRPFPRYHLDAFTDEFRDLRASVRPGITGLWQVTTRSDADLSVQEELDTYYIRNWSLWMDLYVLVRTPIVVVTQRGAR